MGDHQPTTIGLFVTCLADLFRPSVAFDTLTLLENAGCLVEVPEHQTCCGQPAYNTGAYGETRAIARQLITAFTDYRYVVTPSGSCAGIIKHHYPRLLQDSREWCEKATELADKTWEITSFLYDVMHIESAPQKIATQGKRYTYHDGCAGLREMGIRHQPRRLLRQLQDIDIEELERAEVCCGFGGTFCARMPEISEKMVDDKLDSALASGAQVLLGGDLGCLMNIAGRARRRGRHLEVRHVVEILAGSTDKPAIGESQA